MPELIICRGLPGSGKTSRARIWVADDPANRARVNRDDLRAMLHDGTYLGRDTEDRVVAARDAAIEALLLAGSSVISDDTNLAQPVARQLARLGRRVGADVSVWDLTDEPLDVCLARDAARPHPVGEDVIRGMAARYLAGKAYPLPLPEDAAPEKVEPYVPDASLPDAWLVDLDGTLALMDGRGPFEWHRVGEDACNEPVRDLVWALGSTLAHVVVLSGRDSVCRWETERWLERHDVSFDALFMRAYGDTRKDAVVKLEMFRNLVAPRYNVRGVIDDRDQVVEMWRSLGLLCAQVAPGNF